MSDAAVSEMPEQLKEGLEKISDTTKRGFDLKSRLKNRGLRKGAITLYLDEEKGPELGWAYDVKDALDNIIGRQRDGVIGDLEVAVEGRAKLVADYGANAAAQGVLESPAAKKDAAQGKKAYDSAIKMADDSIKEMEAKRDQLIEELTKSALVLKLRAVPPIIQRDCRRKAKSLLHIESKNVPDDKMDDLEVAHTAYLMAVVIQSITDNETGETNSEVTYEDAVDLMDYLPKGQFARLDMMIGEVQFMDAISLSIERQEDFS